MFSNLRHESDRLVSASFQAQWMVQFVGNLVCLSTIQSRFVACKSDRDCMV